ncbi:hypothetical protein ACFP2T_18035 [Plantactinospora solaniradicis]|uniref:Uncharacterized protein n=1 Tax=Plantactinospora solaniradicis TaxID=1723736 RepID=A0ABW1K9C8_9ACTN
MTKDRDMMTIVEKLRPITTVDDRWPRSTRDAVLENLLIATVAERPEAPPRSRRRRVAFTAVLTAALVASGASIAVAGGLLPESFTRPLSFWETETGGAVDVQTARRVAQAPGPDGTVLTVWSAKGQDGTICIAPLFEPPGDLDRPAPTSFKLAGGQCADTDQGMEPFSTMGGSEDGRGIHTMWAAAGSAARAELRLPDGSLRSAVRAEDMFFFWYLANESVDPPLLVGYDAAGNVVAEQSTPNLRTPVHPHTGG